MRRNTYKFIRNNVFLLKKPLFRGQKTCYGIMLPSELRIKFKTIYRKADWRNPVGFLPITGTSPFTYSVIPIGRQIYGYGKGAIFMPHYDPETIERARQVDLLTYLQTCESQKLVHVSGNVYCTKTLDSLRISNGKWCWFSRGIGGYSALDYLIKVNGYSFMDAMETITGGAVIRPPSFVPTSAAILKLASFQSLQPVHLRGHRGSKSADCGRTTAMSRALATLSFSIGIDGSQDGSSDHIGIVEKVENGRIYAIEGNFGDSCHQNSYPVGYYEIYGYGTPAY